MDYGYYEGANLKKPRIEDFTRTFFYQEGSGKVLSEEMLKEIFPKIRLPLPVKFNIAEKASLKKANIVYQTTADKEAFKEAMCDVEIELGKREKAFLSVLIEHAFDNLNSSKILNNSKILPFIYDESRVVRKYNDTEILDAKQTHENFKKNLQFARILFEL